MRNTCMEKSAKLVVRAFLLSKLNYCNSSPYGCTMYQCKKLKYVKNTAARIESQISKFPI